MKDEPKATPKCTCCGEHPKPPAKGFRLRLRGGYPVCDGCFLRAKKEGRA